MRLATTLLRRRHYIRDSAADAVLTELTAGSEDRIRIESTAIQISRKSSMDDFGTSSYSGSAIAGTVAWQIAHLILLPAGPGEIALRRQTY